MVASLKDLEMVTNVHDVVGTYGDRYSFSCLEGKYGQNGRDTYLAVKYDDVKEDATPPSMMDAKWIAGTKWDLTWKGLKKNPPTQGEIHNPKSGEWTFLRITSGG